VIIGSKKLFIILLFEIKTEVSQNIMLLKEVVQIFDAGKCCGL
jgi:hypothetical protein